MKLNFSQYLNKRLLVSIPALFEDGVVRPYTLLGVELNGLWLQSEALSDRLLKEHGRDLARMNPAVFVPFAQIAGVLIATSVPPPLDESTSQTPPATVTAARGARPTSEDKPEKRASPPKPPKRKSKPAKPASPRKLPKRKSKPAKPASPRKLPKRKRKH